MKSMAQLFRQPIKTGFGIILIALAVAILCVCVGQAMVAQNYEAALGETFTTIALPTEIYQLSGYDSVKQTLPEEVSAWIQQMTAENPDIVKAVTAPGLASAYVPQLQQDNHTNYPYNDNGEAYRYMSLTSQPTGAPYSTAILEITLTEVGDVEAPEDLSYVSCTGTINSILSLEEGYPDTTGFAISLSVPLSQAASLETGERYLVFGYDYFDRDWMIRSEESKAMDTGHITIEAFDPNCLTWFSPEQVDNNRQWNPVVYDVALYSDYENGIHFTLSNITAQHFRSVSMTAADCIRLNGSAKDFLDSGSSVWQSYLEIAQINAHAYPVIGVEKLTHLADFVRGISEITTGREFSKKELDAGANVCLISETLAAVNGLTVGDTITLTYYAYDGSLSNQGSLNNGNGIINAGASYYTQNTIPAPAQEYTIIGLSITS